MSTPTHTPGPWTAVPRADLAENGNVIVESSCEVICHVFNDNNAPLIAKAPIAPKLADALRALCGYADHLANDANVPLAQRQNINEARAVLAEWEAQ